MSIRKTISIGLALVAGMGLVADAGLAAPRKADREALALGKPTGPAQTCIQLRQIRNTRVRDDRTIDFVMIGKDRVFRNTLPYACPQLGFEERFSYATSLSQLCNVDIITVLTQAGGLTRGASCGLGQFTPISLPRKYR